MKALCIRGTFSGAEYGGPVRTAVRNVEQWTVLTMDDATATRLAALYSSAPVMAAAGSPSAGPAFSDSRGRHRSGGPGGEALRPAAPTSEGAGLDPDALVAQS